MKRSHMPMQDPTRSSNNMMLLLLNLQLFHILDETLLMHLVPVSQ
jgi:hypothetical protein